MYFGAILCKKARQLRVYKAFGGRRHTEGRCSSIDENGKSRHSVWLSDDVWQEVDAFYKLAVEHNMTNHLLGGDMDMTRDEYSKMRGSSVREVSATHGTISFKDVLLFYKED